MADEELKDKLNGQPVTVEQARELITKPAERELLCQRCGLEYEVWYAPNGVWNRVQREGEHFLCPTCFTVLAQMRGEAPIAWMLVENHGLDDLYKLADDFIGHAFNGLSEHQMQALRNAMADFSLSELQSERRRIADELARLTRKNLHSLDGLETFIKELRGEQQ